MLAYCLLLTVKERRKQCKTCQLSFSRISIKLDFLENFRLKLEKSQKSKIENYSFDWHVHGDQNRYEFLSDLNWIQYRWRSLENISVSVCWIIRFYLEYSLLNSIQRIDGKAFIMVLTIDIGTHTHIHWL